MRPGLTGWVTDADRVEHERQFGSQLDLPTLVGVDRVEDLYISLIGELFERIEEGYELRSSWSGLANAFLQCRTSLRSLPSSRADESEAALFGAIAFYLGGFSASAYLCMQGVDTSAFDETETACYEFITRKSRPTSALVDELVFAIRRGAVGSIERAIVDSEEAAEAAREYGPQAWVAATLLSKLMQEFGRTNVRSVLPSGESSVWNPLVDSFLDRSDPVWDFFPSQVEAIHAGFLTAERSSTVQMPTGSGKTALTETLLFHHAMSIDPVGVAVLLVPFRSIAAELRHSVARRLTGMGLPTRCIYGGTTPTPAEAQSLAHLRVIIATPEALTGLLSAEQELADRISLVICDEGHLLESGSRGIAFELLIARLRRPSGVDRRFVFMSAIVPNVEEINAWLGGDENSVIRSSFSSAPAEFARIQSSGTGTTRVLGLEVHPRSVGPETFVIEGFLAKQDFTYVNSATGRDRTFPYSSVKAHAIGSARKALSLGSVAVFAANKTGNQGVSGLAEELLSQLEAGIPLPSPSEFVQDGSVLSEAVEYVEAEFGTEWVGSRALRAGAVVHHGDLPQELREVAESLFRRSTVPLAFCTSTLAEGVNLPIRTLVLYSVQRMGADGERTDLNTRDIRNLVGRAGRPGGSTRGLIICANPNQWAQIERVAIGERGERIEGTLFRLMGRLRSAIAESGLPLTNSDLEDTPELFSLIDGIDATLVELASEELGSESLVEIAGEVSQWTYAYAQGDAGASETLKRVFEVRASRINELQATGQFSWIRRSGISPRLAQSVDATLYGVWDWTDGVDDPTSRDFLRAVVSWVWSMPEMTSALSNAYRDSPPSMENFVELVGSWIEGHPYANLSERSALAMDRLLPVLNGPVVYTLHELVDQGLSALVEIAAENDLQLPDSVRLFSQHLKFGVPTEAARQLASHGVRHRQASIELGAAIQVRLSEDEELSASELALEELGDAPLWVERLGRLVFKRTEEDLANSRP